MKKPIASLIRIVLLLIIWLAWWLMLSTSLPKALNLTIIMGGVLLTFPLVWLGRKIIDLHPTVDWAIRTTTLVHFGLGFTFGIPIVLAISTHSQWQGWILPVPTSIGLGLVFITGAVTLLTVVNLALKGAGAPFFIRLSQRLASDWFYARTRNPMVVASLALLISLGIWFQSAWFVLWALFLFTPALLFFIKVFEERELELRFGESYLEYKSKTPMLFPGKRRT